MGSSGKGAPQTSYGGGSQGSDLMSMMNAMSAQTGKQMHAQYSGIGNAPQVFSQEAMPNGNIRRTQYSAPTGQRNAETNDGSGKTSVGEYEGRGNYGGFGSGRNTSGGYGSLMDDDAGDDSTLG